MFFRLLFLSTVFGAFSAFQVLQDANITAFRRVGTLTDGAGHAHLIVRFNVTDEVCVAKDLLTGCQFAAKNGSEILWRPFLTRLRPQVKDWVSFEREVAALSRRPPTDTESGRRTKRNPVLLGAVVISAVGIGAFSLYETKKLSDRVNGVDKSLNHMFASLDSSLAAEESMALDIKNLRSGLQNATNIISGVAAFELEYGAADEILHRLGTRLTALRGLLHHHLPVELLEDKGLQRGFERLQRRVEAAGFRLVIDNVLQLFSQETSFSVTEGVVDLMIHLPVLPGGHPPAQLYQHLPLPVRHGSEVQLVAGKADFLAVFKDEGTYIELSAADLTACYVSDMDFRCPVSFPRTRGGGAACLPALFEQRLEVAADTCLVTPLHNNIEVFRLNSTAFVLASKKEVQVDVRCGKDPKEEAKKVQGVAIIALEDGCVATTDEVVFTARRAHLPEDLHTVVSNPSLAMFNATVTAGSNFRAATFPDVNTTGSELAELAVAREELDASEKAEADVAAANSSWWSWWPTWASWGLSGLLLVAVFGCALTLRADSPVGMLFRHICARHAGAAFAAHAADAVTRFGAPPSSPGAGRAASSVVEPAAPAAPVTPVCVTVNTSECGHYVSDARALPAPVGGGRGRSVSAPRGAATASPENPVVFRLK